MRFLKASLLLASFCCSVEAQSQTLTVDSLIAAFLASIQAQLVALRDSCPQLSDIETSQIWSKPSRTGFMYEKGILANAKPFSRTTFSGNGAIIHVGFSYPYLSNEPEQRIPDLDFVFPDGRRLISENHVEAEYGQPNSDFRKIIMPIIDMEIHKLALEFIKLSAKQGPSRQIFAPNPPFDRTLPPRVSATLSLPVRSITSSAAVASPVNSHR